VAQRLEAVLYQPSRARGAVFTVILVTGVAAVTELAARRLGRLTVGGLVLWAALGGRSLRREAIRIADSLDAGAVEDARRALPALVGRDPDGLAPSEICRAVVESVAENTADAVTGPLVWLAFAGPAGTAAYRSANTLDAMVGHRSPRYRDFGWASARLDDVMSWPAARVGAWLAVALAPVVGGSPRRAGAAVARHGSSHPSPNAGQMEAAFAGALDVRLGGPLAYEGRVEERPQLGSGRAPTTADIRRAVRVSSVVGLATAGLCALIGRPA
jgi:adenosylcobinamide-phosphate synthase